MDREIYVDRKRSASLRTPMATLQFLNADTAINHWRNLPTDEQDHAALVLDTGETYQPAEIPLIRFK